LKEAILLTYMGAPSNLNEIKPFLFRLFSDRDLINFGVPYFLQKPLAYVISTFRTPKVKPQYEAIGGGSPLVKYSLEQASLLEKETGLKVFTGMLYSEPLLEKVTKEIENSNVEKLYVLTLYPQYSKATAGACIRDVKKLLEEKVELKIVKSWCRNESYIKWIREALKKVLDKSEPRNTAVLFSAHSLPEYFIKELKDVYIDEVNDTVNLVMNAFPKYKWFISYQSKVGPIKWLEPSTEETIKNLKDKGFKKVVVFPVSFVSEHIETLYELDVEYKKLAEEIGLEFERVKLDHKSPLLIDALKSEIEKLRLSEEK